ncbi:hypothetical protein GCM10027169_02120 [Gordonia jinhuaensis]|uniref:Nudix hydrolase domain-containing protein n=1 Tax=Gordonia jinhuaensis TaxID=1517702 RepID=A0A916T1Y4_9ACTN|nr:NUDIX domain-containing protein [Gordonia jinhuaensis]GGB28328.1 hypothetical protein GCM10011489_15650 [Gordonia jinhuaensis]
MNRLTVAAVCLLDDRGRLLVVRKRNTHAFMLPGGKHEPGETDIEAAIREVREEVGLNVDILTPLGRWVCPAANEADTDVEATVFASQLRGEPVAAAEIAEIAWIDPRAPLDAGRRVFAPLMTPVCEAIAERELS